MKTIKSVPMIGLLLAAGIFAEDAAKPKLNTDQRLKASQLQLQLVLKRETAAKADTELKDANAAYNAFLDELRISRVIGPLCQLDVKQEPDCPQAQPAPEDKKSSTKKQEPTKE